MQDSSTIRITKKLVKHVRFLICHSCFWCASDLAGGYVEKCPRCYDKLGSVAVTI